MVSDADELLAQLFPSGRARSITRLIKDGRRLGYSAEEVRDKVISHCELTKGLLISPPKYRK